MYAFVYSTIALEPVILQLICTENLRQILQRTRISQVLPLLTSRDKLRQNAHTQTGTSELSL